MAMARPGTATHTPPETQPPAGHWRRAPAWLLWSVLLAHVLGLEWMTRHTTTGHAWLQTMTEPTFDRALAPQAQLPGNSGVTDTPGEPPAATPTVGQVVQARTVIPPAPSAATGAPATRSVAKPRAASPKLPPAAIGSGTDASPPATTNPYTETAAPTAGDQTAGPADAPKTTVEPTAPDVAATPLPTSAPLASTAPATMASQGTANDDPAVWLATWPRSTRLGYHLKGYFRGDFQGHARVQWQRSGQRYQAQVQVSVGLLLDMRLTSQGRITATRLWPEVYEEDRRGKKRGARFGDQMVTLDNGSTLSRPSHLQDTASQFVQLAQDFATGHPPLQVGATVPVTLGRPGGLDDWLYDVVALESVTTPMGDLAAYHLKPRPLANPRGTVTAEIWFAPALQHLPVRIKLTLNPETWLDLTLDSVTQSD